MDWWGKWFSDKRPLAKWSLPVDPKSETDKHLLDAYWCAADIGVKEALDILSAYIRAKSKAKRSSEEEYWQAAMMAFAIGNRLQFEAAYWHVIKEQLILATRTVQRQQRMQARRKQWQPLVEKLLAENPEAKNSEIAGWVIKELKLDKKQHRRIRDFVSKVRSES